jgi:hypothetical protein
MNIIDPVIKQLRIRFHLKLANHLKYNIDADAVAKLVDNLSDVELFEKISNKDETFVSKKNIMNRKGAKYLPDLEIIGRLKNSKIVKIILAFKHK